MIFLLAIAIGSLFAGAVYLILRRSVAKLILGLMLLSHAVNLLIFTMGDGGVRRGALPIVDYYTGEVMPNTTDPLVQALILTAIVISFGITAFIMALAYRATQAMKTDDLDDMANTDRL